MNLVLNKVSSFVATVALGAASLAFVPHALAQEAADTAIKKVVDEVVTTIKNDKALQAGDRKRINELVEAKIVPNLNFERMTREAMAQNWAKASPEQQKQITAEFRLLLIRTYSGALAGYKEGTVIKYKPNRNLGDGEVLVRSEVVQPGAEPIALDYFMEKAGNTWKVFDINILGARLVENYRGTFRSEVNQSGIDGLIKSLSAMNKSAMADSKKG
jgi:phospholipid transport system substrate-binding protein